MRNSFQIIDYLAEARTRYTEQFRYDESGASAPIFDKYVQLLLGGKVELQEVFRQLMQERSLDTAVGVNLDNIGEIVGQPRTLLSVDMLSSLDSKVSLMLVDSETSLTPLLVQCSMMLTILALVMSL